MSIFSKKHKKEKTNKQASSKDSILRQEEFYPYFILDKSTKLFIGTLFLTENQAYTLNNIFGDDKKETTYEFVRR